MINRIQVTTVFVTDVDKAIDWYTNTLGLSLKIDVPMGETRWVEVVPDGADTSIALNTPWPGMTVGGPTGFLFDVDDVAALVASLRKKGAEITKDVTEQPWGAIEARVADPDGNEFSLVERGDANG